MLYVFVRLYCQGNYTPTFINDKEGRKGESFSSASLGDLFQDAIATEIFVASLQERFIFTLMSSEKLISLSVNSNDTLCSLILYPKDIKVRR